MVRIVLRYTSIQSYVKYLKISVSYLMKCIYKNVRSILEVSRLVPTRMENYIKELSILWFYDSRIERVHHM